MFLITGSQGQLGSALRKIYSSKEAHFMDRSSLDISDIKVIEKFIKENSITGIINCAAYTAVDKAETEQDLCFRTNIDGITNLSQASCKFDIPIIHISTDYVFGGTSFLPYKETDPLNPQSIYGTSKAKGEESFFKYAKSGIILRTSWLYSEFGSNFFKTIVKLANDKDDINVIFDQISTPTYADDLAKVIYKVMPKITNGEKEIYHFSNEGVASWYDFAYEIVAMKKIDCKVKPIESKDYPLPAKRPFYSVLNKTKIKEKFNIDIRHWKEALSECIKKTS